MYCLKKMFDKNPIRSRKKYGGMNVYPVSGESLMGGEVEETIQYRPAPELQTQHRPPSDENEQI